MYSIAVFKSAREAIKADKVCRDNNLNTRVIPVPKHISSECGMCLRLLSAEADKVKELIEENNIKVTIYND
ncbi:MAG: DUF3343 domain-containing protein [Rikenellaceae bacterium]